ncbi:DUF6612 family protein [Thermoactinomyces mirandus]|uniref:Lipoprotein n=1 Tax=Thermoactinomyces mirandus TaxID=2756294 RepID=A0A7W2ARJ0_9BACL|nr:DUF6612 family protein [Thermoactinomyces mirandus]MBA4602633.1 hypothetical protein [Thermoactinomyces mirandus]
MRNFWKLFSVAILSGLLLISGCSSDGTKNPEADKAAPELTPTEVIDKSIQTMDQIGYTYDLKSNQNITTSSGDLSQTLKTEIKSTVNITSNPIAFHVKGSVESNGMQLPIEMYLVENTFYNKVPDAGWAKATMDTSAFEASQDPTAALKQLEQLIQKMGGNVLPEGITLNKASGAYVLEMNLTALNNDPSFQDMLKEQLKSSFQSSSGINLGSLDQMKIENFNQKIWIDEKTFKQTRIAQDMKISFPVEGSTLTIDQHLEMNLKGEYTETIQVPEEVKNSAQRI